MTDLTIDLRLAWRRLRAAPAFTLFSVLTLALGIGATTAIYSVIDAALLRPPHIKDIDRVVNLYHSNPTQATSLGQMAFSWPDYQDLRAAQTSFGTIAAWARFRDTLISDGTAEIILGEMVSGDFFRLVGIEAGLGRTIDEQDDRPAAPPVIVLSDRLWRRRFGADRAVLGKAVRLNGQAFVVIGVAPWDFRGVDMPNVSPTVAWVPLSHSDRLNAGSSRDRTDRQQRWLMVKGRLKPGQTGSAAATEVAAIGRQLDAAYPLAMDVPSDRRLLPREVRRWTLIPTRDLMLHESVHRVAGPIAVTVLVVVALVLLVTCTNIANLLLARGTTRRHELAVRLSLGASRGRLVREQLIESALICVTGALVSLGVAQALMVGVLSTPMQGAPGLTIQIAPAIDTAVGVFALAATTLAFLVFGLGPALQLTRADLRQALATDSATTSLPRWRGRRLLVAGQVGVSVGLAAVAVLCVQQISAAARHESGVDLERLALVRLNFRLQGDDEARARETVRAILDGARREARIGSIAVSSGLPFGIGTPGAVVASLERPMAADGRGGRVAELMASTPQIFSALGVAIRGGRAFDERDHAAALRVVIVSERLAQLVFGSVNVVGRDLVVTRRRWVGETDPIPVTRTIVGVAAETDAGAVGRREGGVIYVPFEQHYEPDLTIIARTPGDPRPVVDALRILVSRVDPELAIFDAGTGLALAGPANLPLQIAAGLAGTLGVLALVLAMTGLYGVLSYLVTRRTAEIGIRRALGATTAQIARLVVVDGLRPIIEGLVIGIGLGVLARLGLWPIFRRLSPSLDPVIIGAIVGLFIVAGLLASYLPARRAARVDPLVALRQL